MTRRAIIIFFLFSGLSYADDLTITVSTNSIKLIETTSGRKAQEILMEFWKARTARSEAQYIQIKTTEDADLKKKIVDELLEKEPVKEEIGE